MGSQAYKNSAQAWWCDKSTFIFSNKENRLNMSQALRVCEHGCNSKLHKDAFKHCCLLFWELSLSLFQHSLSEGGPVSEWVRISVPNGPIWAGNFASSHLNAETGPSFRKALAEEISSVESVRRVMFVVTTFVRNINTSQKLSAILRFTLLETSE
jgi:hypothetical protein